MDPNFQNLLVNYMGVNMPQNVSDLPLNWNPGYPVPYPLQPQVAPTPVPHPLANSSTSAVRPSFSGVKNVVHPLQSSSHSLNTQVGQGPATSFKSKESVQVKVGAQLNSNKKHPEYVRDTDAVKAQRTPSERGRFSVTNYNKEISSQRKEREKSPLGIVSDRHSDGKKHNRNDKSPHEKSPERNPRGRKCDRSPIARERSSHVRERSPLVRERNSRVRERSPLVRERNSRVRERSPRVRVPERHPQARERSRSPLVRKHDRNPHQRRLEKNAQEREIDRCPRGKEHDRTLHGRVPERNSQGRRRDGSPHRKDNDRRSHGRVSGRNSQGRVRDRSPHGREHDKNHGKVHERNPQGREHDRKPHGREHDGGSHRRVPERNPHGIDLEKSSHGREHDRNHHKRKCNREIPTKECDRSPHGNIPEKNPYGVEHDLSPRGRLSKRNPHRMECDMTSRREYNVIPHGKEQDMSPCGKKHDMSPCEMSTHGREHDMSTYGREYDVIPRGREHDMSPRGKKRDTSPHGSDMSPRGRECVMIPFGRECDMSPHGRDYVMSPRGSERDTIPRGREFDMIPRGRDFAMSPRGSEPDMSPCRSERDMSLERDHSMSPQGKYYDTSPVRRDHMSQGRDNDMRHEMDYDMRPQIRESDRSDMGLYEKNLSYTVDYQCEQSHDYDERYREVNPNYCGPLKGNSKFEGNNSPNYGSNLKEKNHDFEREMRAETTNYIRMNTRDKTSDYENRNIIDKPQIYERNMREETPDYERNITDKNPQCETHLNWKNPIYEMAFRKSNPNCVNFVPNRSTNNEINVGGKFEYDKSYKPNTSSYRSPEENTFCERPRVESPPPKWIVHKKNPSPYFNKYSESCEDDPWDSYDPGNYCRYDEDRSEPERRSPKAYDDLQKQSYNRNEITASSSFKGQEIQNRSFDKEYCEFKNIGDSQKSNSSRQVDSEFYHSNSQCDFDIIEKKSGPNKHFFPQSIAANEVNFAEDTYYEVTYTQPAFSNVPGVKAPPIIDPIYAPSVEDQQEFNDRESSCFDEVDMEESESDEDQPNPNNPVSEKIFKNNLNVALFPTKSDLKLERIDAKPMNDMMTQLIEDKAKSYAQGNKEQQLRFVSPGKLWSHSYKIFCADQETFDWMLNWKPPIYNGMELSVRRTLKFIERIGIFLHGVKQKIDVELFLNQISSQNANLNTSLWRCLINKYDRKGNGLYLIFDVDGESHKVITLMGNKLYYLTSTVVVRTLQKKNTKYKKKKNKRKKRDKGFVKMKKK